MEDSLKIFTLGQNEKWDFLVRSFEKYDVYWLSGYVKSFKLHGDGEPILFYYEDGKTRGINVVMRRDIAKFPYFAGKIEEEKYFDFATPYGYGGWLIEGENHEKLFEEYGIWCRKNNIVSEFVRFHPIVENHNVLGQEYQILPLGETVVMELNNPEEIWWNLTGKNRNVIRKAIKNEVKIYNGRFPRIYGKFREIYNRKMEEDHADIYYFFKPEFYRILLEELPLNAQIFFAQIPDGTVIAAAVILAANGRMNYHLSASVKEYSALAPTNLLLYQVALWGYTNGYKTLYLGGGVGAAQDNLFKFKKAFSRGETKSFYIGKKIFMEGVYEEFIQMRKDLNMESRYFPLYRAEN